MSPEPLTPLPDGSDEVVLDAVSGKPLLQLHAEPVQSLVVGRWYGTATPESVQLGMRGALDFIRRYPLTRGALSDGSHFRGDWTDLLPWINYEYLPQLLRLNLRAMAFIPSGTPSASLGINNFALAARPRIAVQLFFNEAEARQWLAKMVAGT